MLENKNNLIKTIIKFIIYECCPNQKLKINTTKIRIMPVLAHYLVTKSSVQCQLSIAQVIELITLKSLE